MPVDPITETMQAFSAGRLDGSAFAIGRLYGLSDLELTKAGTFGSIPRVRPSEAASKISADGALIYDVRSHGYYDRKARRIQGS